MLCRVVHPNSKSKYTLVFFSGFGADYNYWNDVLPYFSNYECVLLSENYFCEPNEVTEDQLKKIFKGKKLIGIGHSLGYMKLCLLQEKYDFFKLSKLIAVEGFSNYLGSKEPMRSMRKIALEYMKVCYSINPIGTLVWFQTICGAMPDIPQKIDQDLLQEELKLLDEKIITPSVPHLVLSSIDDFIVPFYIIQDNFGQCAKIIYTQIASHLLGMRYSKYVHDEILNFIE
ncbi:MAG: hypothetical protein K6C34_03440 [Alphaproteobacteria bacterium]|nr:hypothetical protein [Alphaproteobacteria bacterium]